MSQLEDKTVGEFCLRGKQYTVKHMALMDMGAHSMYRVDDESGQYITSLTLFGSIDRQELINESSKATIKELKEKTT